MTTAPNLTRAPDEDDAALAREIRRVLRAAEKARKAGRRDGDELRPLGKKAARTRQQLLIAAYSAFVSRGYLSTSVQDIHEMAEVSLGTFYQYFRDKADVMAALVGDAIVDMADEVFIPLELHRGRSGVRTVIESFVTTYAETAEFQRLWEEVTHVEEDLARLRYDVSRLLDTALRRAIEHGQRAGIVDPALDAKPTSRALAAMVDRYCYVTYVADPPRGGPPPVEDTVNVLTALWVNALGLPE